MSSVAVASFRWLDMLEKEFDKAVIDFDLSLNDIQAESDNGDLLDETLNEFVENSRDKLKTISTAWSQLVHKSQTIFQVNCKLEMEQFDSNEKKWILSKYAKFVQTNSNDPNIGEWKVKDLNLINKTNLKFK